MLRHFAKGCWETIVLKLARGIKWDRVIKLVNMGKIPINMFLLIYRKMIFYTYIKITKKTLKYVKS